MESLLENYASSDDEEEQQQPEPSSNPTSNSTQPSPSITETPKTFSLLSSLPQPKTSSLLSSLPQPKSSSLLSSLPHSKTSPISSYLPEPKSSSLHSSFLEPKSSSVIPSLPETKSPSFLSSLPPPKSHLTNSQPPTNMSSSDSDTKPKKVIQFKLPVNPYLLKPHEVEDEEDDEKEKKKERKPIKEFMSSSQTSSVKSFISSLPVPKSSLGSGAPPSLGSGRRSIIEADSPTTNSNSPSLNSDGYRAENGSDCNENSGNWVDGSSSEVSGSDPAYWVSGNENYESYKKFDNYGTYGNYDANWVDKSMPTVPEISGMVESVERMPGKRGRNGVPLEIVEVNQDELIKNRPREDQVKLTGIAFGPSYQPVSSKGKPSKLHKRKHQIGSLYFDMKQKETELSERRSKGFLTKAETQAKYGW